MQPHYIAIDLETTGLDPELDRILEIAAIVLTKDLEPVSQFTVRILCPSDMLEAMPDVVKEMHLGTGLICEQGSTLVLADGVELPFAEDLLVETLGIFEQPPALLGHSVHFDRAFLRRWMPTAHAKLSHRNIDARTVQELLPDYPWPEANPKHRAMPDIERSVEILRIGRRLLRSGAEIWLGRDRVGGGEA